ncbi:MAG: DedA family protein [Candidatus Omnitrophota bacterium]
MELIQQGIQIFFHIDTVLSDVIQRLGPWTYVLLFGIIFCETGLVVTPFLPGDSLLFAAGAFAAAGDFNLAVLLAALMAAAVLGDGVNYAIGKTCGEALLQSRLSRFVKKEYLERTQKFYEKHGGKTIVLARFIPIIRTFAPFVAGIGHMRYLRFFVFNVTGAFLWVVIFVVGGFLFGNVPVIKENFSMVIVGIVVLSVVPTFIEARRRHR